MLGETDSVHVEEQGSCQITSLSGRTGAG
ncbi:uncharacterized protein METZ01_LOCUS190624, partial [marine metagenome]